MTPINKLLRMDAGTTETYLLKVDEAAAFAKKIATYAFRTGAKIDTRQAVVIFLDTDTVQRMIIVKVVKPGRKMKKRGRRAKKG